MVVTRVVFEMGWLQMPFACLNFLIPPFELGLLLP